MMKMQIRDDIQFLRAVAVVAVLLYHTSPSLFPNGYLGVDIFFVVSGYVITPLIGKIFELSSGGRLQFRFRNYWEFMQRRFWRLVPAFATTLLFFSPIFYFFSLPEDSNKYAIQSLFAMIFAGNFGAYKLTGDYFHPNPNPLIHTWSLSLEEQVYLFLPLIVFLFSKFYKKNNALWIVTCLTIPISLILFLRLDLFTNLVSFLPLNSRDLSFYSPVTRVWEFSCGSLVYFASIKGKRLNLKKMQSVVLNSLLVIMIFANIFLSFKSGSILIVVLTMLVIHTESFIIRTRFLNRFLLWLGNRSYSVYLIHMPLLFVVMFYPTFNQLHNSIQFLLILMSITLILLLSNLNYIFVENRYRYRHLIAIKVHSLASIMLLLVLTLVSVLSILLLNKQRFLLDPLMPPESAIFTQIDNIPSDPASPCDFNFDLRKPCKYENSNSKGTIVLIGDSHAGSLLQTSWDIARSFNYSLYTFTAGGCPLLPRHKERDFLSFHTIINHNCSIRDSSVYSFLDMNRVDYIIYFQRVSDVYVQPNTYANRGILNFASLNALNELSKMVDNTIVIGFTPLLEKKLTPFDTLIGNKNSFSSIPLADNAYWQGQSVRFGCKFVDAYSLFCDTRMCSNNENGTWLFRDSNHLSYSGATRIGDQLKTLIPTLH